MKPEDSLSIGEFARIVGITPNSLRVYDSKGIFSPAMRGNGLRFLKFYSIWVLNVAAPALNARVASCFPGFSCRLIKYYIKLYYKRGFYINKCHYRHIRILLF
ncbi:MAG: MerR family DNA-binding transcriptional regulator [Clostridiales bacterium]|jgi:hypothetical protein|nr:MerR family DNA-binding transcriptional regulator [Clostridiales bacterium]